MREPHRRNLPGLHDRSHRRHRPATILPGAQSLAPAPADAETRRRLPDLFGWAYLTAMGVVMTAWIGILVWIALEAASWLAS